MGEAALLCCWRYGAAAAGDGGATGAAAPQLLSAACRCTRAPCAFPVICIPFFALRPCDVLNNYYAVKPLRHVTKLMGISWELRGGHNLTEEQGGGVVVSNHQSMLDILGIFNIWDVMKRCAPVAKKEVFWVWPFGVAAWLGGVVFIDRVHPTKAHQQLARASKLMVDNTKLWLFPEGTRNKNPAEMLPFKKGAFRVAISCQAPIFPVVFSPYYMVDGKTKYFGSGKIIIEALPPIPTKGLGVEDLDSLMERTRSIMSEAHKKIYQEAMEYAALQEKTKAQ
ncbi:1-acyl-sn-glycerol-3-phosphate acyltransferase [Gryllus bimaculatus]|nr:1-acyl-sn-glycerol-3-phosphate acyltransferase [Gryllus bimaculatus]